MRRVLAVDDEPVILALVQDILESSGYSIIGVLSAEEALAKMEGEEKFDLILTDLRMPGMSGQTFIAALRRHPTYRRIPIVVLATGADEADLGQLRVDMRISKPFMPKTLITAVGALIG